MTERRSGAGNGAPVHRYLAGSERRTAATTSPGEPSLLKDVAILFGSAVALAGLGLGAYWSAWTPTRSSAQTVGRTAEPARGAPPIAPAPTIPVHGPLPADTSTVRHADVFFDVNRARLRADAVATLQEQAAQVREEGGQWRVLVLGHSDGRGTTAYNLALAQRRADAVRQFLVELGVPEATIKVATIGQAATVCDDPTPECQQLNRRVHLEVRRVGATPVTVPGDRILHEEGR